MEYERLLKALEKRLQKGTKKCVHIVEPRLSDDEPLDQYCDVCGVLLYSWRDSTQQSAPNLDNPNSSI